MRGFGGSGEVGIWYIVVCREVIIFGGCTERDVFFGGFGRWWDRGFILCFLRCSMLE